MQQDNSRPAVRYPCQWLYKVIGRDSAALTCAVREIMPAEAVVSLSRTSAQGRYVSVNVDVRVGSQQER
ncbi:MAG: DUF493 domain-containing protein, partial [Candidatus Omnitrophica bacterium]|nr:DUF493 domain-containing protein [Candidatus Omnitrophota bacterium]